jgi:hypothetical protein
MPSGVPVVGFSGGIWTGAEFYGVPPVGLSDFSIAFWCVPAADVQVCLSQRIGSGDYAGWGIRKSGTPDKVNFAFDFGSSEVAVSSTTTIQNGVLMHVAITVDRDATEKIYINGQYEAASASIAAHASVNVQNTAKFEAGRYSVASAHMDGFLGQVCAWNRLLSAYEIKVLANPLNTLLNGWIPSPTQSFWFPFSGETLPPGVYATDCESIRSGNWSSASTWHNGVIPDSTKTVTISPNTTVEMDANASCGELTVLGGLVVEGATLTMAGDVSLGSSANKAALTIGGGGTLAMLTYALSIVNAKLLGRASVGDSGAISGSGDVYVNSINAGPLLNLRATWL